MRFELKLVESVGDITQLVLNAIKDYLEPRIPKILNSVQSQLPDLVAKGLREEPEYQSLISGELRAEFGLPESSTAESVVQALSRTIQVSSQPISIKQSGVSGGFIINMIKSDDLGGVINSSLAKISIDGGSLPWLEWLTFQGNRILVREYIVEYGPNPNSRSGMAVMKSSKGGSWRVPPAFIGTINNNWITRAISRIENNVYDLIVKSVEAQI